MATAATLLRVLSTDFGSESDAALLARYADLRDEDAFATLFHRHGPMVRSVCRRHCRDAHLAADAEQGVWLVLARKAANLSRPDRLANWLFGVAVRIGRKIAAGAHRGGLPPRRIGAVPDTTVSVMAEELLRVLDEELAALSEDERLPLVLCYLEGQTQDEAARVCGTCVRTLRRRLDRGRETLRRRLERRGVAPAAAFAALAIAPASARAAPEILEAALKSDPLPSTLSPWIAEELAMTSVKWWTCALVVAGLVLTAAIAGAGIWADDAKPTTPADTQPAPRVADAVPADLPKGAVVRLGSVAFRHPGEVEGLAFSPGGKQLVAVGPAAIRRWAMPDGAVVVAAGDREKGYRHLSVTDPAGRRAVELFNSEPDAPKGTLYTAHVTDLTTGHSAGTFLATYGDAQAGPYSLAGAISPDGSTLAVQYCAEVSLYALPDGKLLRRLADDVRVFRNVAFTPDGKHLVVGSLDQFELTVWDVATGVKLKVLGADGLGTGGLSVSPDGKTVVAAGNRQERVKNPEGGTRSTDHAEAEFAVWDLASGKLLRRVTADAPLRTVHCLPDGTVIGVVEPAETFAKSALRRWRLADGKLLWSAAADHGIHAFAVSSDGGVLASAGGGGIIRLWDASTGKVQPPSEGHSQMMESIAFSADGKIVRTTDGSELRTWDATSGRPTGRFTHAELIGYARWDAAGRVVAAGPNTIDDTRRTVAVFDAIAGKKLLSVSDPGREKGFGSLGFDLSADGKRLCLPVTVDKTIQMQLWDVPSAKQVWDVAMPADWSPRGVAITADGRVLVGTTDLITLDAATGKQLARWDLVKSGALPTDETRNTHLYPSRDGRTLGFVIQNVGIFLVDSRTGKLIRQIDTPGEVHWPLTFSPDGSRFATSNAWNDTGIRVWETATGKLLWRFDGSPSRVVEIAFSPDGRRLASGCIDGTALVWDLSGLK